MVFLLLHLVFSVQVWPVLVYLWIGMVVLWFVYPLFGLFLVRAPGWAYLAVLSGPLFMLWRTWLNLRVRLSRQAISWVRTPHQNAEPSGK